MEALPLFLSVLQNSLRWKRKGWLQHSSPPPAGLPQKDPQQQHCLRQQPISVFCDVPPWLLPTTRGWPVTTSGTSFSVKDTRDEQLIWAISSLLLPEVDPSVFCDKLTFHQIRPLFPLVPPCQIPSSQDRNADTWLLNNLPPNLPAGLLRNARQDPLHSPMDLEPQKGLSEINVNVIE